MTPGGTDRSEETPLTPIRWATGFLDFPADRFEAGTRFWAEVLGCSLSARRGDREQFLTFLPPDGDACWRAQSLLAGPGGAHLDLHVDDVPAEAGRAVGLGATEVFAEDGLTVLRSPGGLGICLSRWDGETAIPAPIGEAGDSRCRADQLCIDVPPGLWETETAFLAALTGVEPQDCAGPEFRRLPWPDHLPIGLLIQRLDDAADRPVRAHVDLAAGDGTTRVARHHQALGASWVRSGPHWITLRDPAGTEYCLTDRDPEHRRG